jgi:hypothetical protein
MDPATYQLLNCTAFVVPINPGLTAVYPQWAAPTMVKMIDAMFCRKKKYFLSYKNILRACFRMFNINITAQLKVSNTPALTEWNFSTMSIIDILNQLQDSYGKLTMMTLFQNNVMFRNPMAPTDSPKMLFYRIEQCQEIQCIGKLSYSDEQIIANAVRILIQINIFPLKEFNTWEAMTPKTYPALKRITLEAYSRRLMAMALRSMSGQNGYAHQMIYNVMEAGISDDTDNNTVMKITQTAALTAATGDTTPSRKTAISAKVATAINQLSANQTAIMSLMAATSAQMAAMSFLPPLAQHTCAFVPRKPFNVPPIQQVAVLMQQPCAATGIFNAERGGQHGGHGCSCGGGRGSRSRMPFVDAMRSRGAAPVVTNLVHTGEA